MLIQPTHVVSDGNNISYTQHLLITCTYMTICVVYNGLHHLRITCTYMWCTMVYIIAHYMYIHVVYNDCNILFKYHIAV